ncbi:MAG TPA: bacillithiol biosynthesis cysteine-adding enzyme BshC [Bryobacteraceae bacterium]|nr:bacillithiol biosynthesis cysteine-adding enzyme BshC [Bryobacteraceae bacterium]
MPATCVRQTELPNTSALFADVLYRPDRTASFYGHERHDLEAVRAAAQKIEFSNEKRAALVAALRPQNPASPALDRLAQPGTVAVVTGQQVGLFSGPAYTIYKALTAVRLAEALSASGTPAVAAFWLATEDHDFAEVNHAWVFDGEHRPAKIEMSRSVSAQPVGGVTLSAPPIRELRAGLRGLPFGEEVADLVEGCYRPGSTMGKAFGELLRQLCAHFDILQIDPMLPAFRELAAPALRAAVEAAPDITARVLERNQQLQAAGYHAQVHVEQHTSFVFLLENGKRLALRRANQEYIQNGRRFSASELIDRAASLSPNALLRPVVQDSMLPTAAYIGGPAETAYLAQSEAIYRMIVGRMPVPMPRSSFTLLDERSHKLFARYSLTLADFFHGQDVLRERIAARLVPPGLNRAMAESAGTVNHALESLKREMAAFDPTLTNALERSERKIRYQLGKIERKAGREALRRDARADRDAASLYGLIYPERHLQERLYSILPFLAKHGLDLVDRLYENLQLDCPDHRLVVI